NKIKLNVPDELLVDSNLLFESIMNKKDEKILILTKHNCFHDYTIAINNNCNLIKVINKWNFSNKKHISLCYEIIKFNQFTSVINTTVDLINEMYTNVSHLFDSPDL